MLIHLKHHVRLAAVLYALFAAVAVLGAQSSSSHTAENFARGVDEFHALAAPMLGETIGLAIRYGPWVELLAVVATLVSVVSAYWVVSEWVNGPGDAAALARHATSRAATHIYDREPPMPWGIVCDARTARTARPLPLAVVDAIDDAGSVMATAIADTIDVPMHSVKQIDPSRRSLSTAKAIRFAQGTAFWVGALTVPMACLSTSGAFSAAMASAFGISAVIRAVGSQKTTHAL